MTNKVRGAQTLQNIYHWTQFVSDEKDIITLVEIKYTLSILQVYFICTSQKKSTFEVYLVCTSRKKV